MTTTTTTTTSAALAGPWTAVIADNDGFVYGSVDDARDNVDPDDEVTITVVRNSAAPNDRNGTTGTRLRLPGSYNSGDVAYALDDVYIGDDEEDVSVCAEARYAQAKAMAAGLNATTQLRELADDTHQLAAWKQRHGIEADWLSEISEVLHAVARDLAEGVPFHATDEAPSGEMQEATA